MHEKKDYLFCSDLWSSGYGVIMPLSTILIYDPRWQTQHSLQYNFII
jgi:hypothetical protein